jgi:hypothetical protein
MARNKSTTKGIQAELEVQLELTKNPDLLVFTPVLGLGMVDIVTLNVKTGEYKAYDVKARSYRLTDVYRDGRKAHPKGSMINRVATDEQKRLGVQIIYPKEKG